MVPITETRTASAVSSPSARRKATSGASSKSNAARREKLSASTDTVRRTASVSQATFLTVERMVPWKEKTVSARRNQHALMTHTGMVKIVGHQMSPTVVRASALRRRRTRVWLLLNPSVMIPILCLTRR
ncbi:hypothetical protein COH21_013039 [Aspergillus flavus]|nr:hypothetical protein COH21_013039 [Aspergillus flavus]